MVLYTLHDSLGTAFSQQIESSDIPCVSNQHNQLGVYTWVLGDNQFSQTLFLIGRGVVSREIAGAIFNWFLVSHEFRRSENQSLGLL